MIVVAGNAMVPLRLTQPIQSIKLQGLILVCVKTEELSTQLASWATPLAQLFIHNNHLVVNVLVLCNLSQHCDGTLL